MRRALLLGTLASVAWLAGCESTSPGEPIVVPRDELPALTVAPSHTILDGGESVLLTATVKYGVGPAVRAAGVTWTSTNEAVATVGNSGLVRGLEDGDAEIVAVWHGARSVAHVTVVGSASNKDEATVACAAVGVPSGSGCR